MLVQVKEGTKDIYDGHMLDDYNEIFILLCEADCGCVVMNARQKFSVHREDLIFL